jgi:succinate dehydrogenase flavin-adding protein (antitoxin of CptAB toxin-antitoxin module)
MELDPFTHRNKIRYLTTRRAVLELELILRDFWERHSSRIPDEDLPDLEKVLEIEDLDLLDMLLKGSPLPEGYRQDLFELILTK